MIYGPRVTKPPSSTLRYRLAGAWSNGAPLTRRQLLRASAIGAAGLALPACSPSSSPTAARTLDAGPPPRPPRPPAPPALPVDLASCRPIAEVTAPASGFLADDFTRPHEVLWKLDEYFTNNGPPPPAREHTDVVVVGGGMSGLGVAWLLRDKKPIVLEQAPRFGGNSKGERWQGIEYSMGAAYFADTDPDEELRTKFYTPLGLDKAWRVVGDDPVVTGEHLQFQFWEGKTDKKRARDFHKAKAWFVDVLKHHYPDIPWAPGGQLDEAALAELDKRSLREELESKLGASLHPHVATLCDHYAWSTFLCGWEEISAAAFLCSFVAEFDGVVVLPGGNAFAAERLLEQTAAAVPPTNLRPSTLVIRVAQAADGVDVTALGPDGAPYTIHAKTCVMACPKFVAKKILVDLPPAQRSAIDRIKYRSYVVANVLVNAPLEVDAYDVYLLGDQPPGADLAAESTKQGVTDVVLGHWAKHGDPKRSVLTLYRPYPYDGARAALFDPASFTRVKGELEQQLPGILSLFKLEPEQVQELRVARWGHPINVSTKGQIADGTWAAARAPIGGRIFFCEQDNWPAPCIETAFLCALETEAAVRKVVTG